MKREIKFRGRRYNGDCVCGDLIHRPNCFPIIRSYGKLNELEEYAIEDGSIGQFTGLYDKNGKEIYEDDIVKKTCIYGYVGMFYTGEVVFKDGSFVIDTHDKYESLRYTNFDYKCEWSDGHCHGVDEYEFEVIGNIYDNPDLIKKK